MLQFYRCHFFNLTNVTYSNMVKTNGQDILVDILTTIKRVPQNKAFVINDNTYTYEDLGAYIASVYHQIAKREDDVIGIIAENNIETYSSILAVLLCGKTYVILHPSYPESRNLKIVTLAGLHTIICSDSDNTDYLEQNGSHLIYPEFKSDHAIETVTYKTPNDNNAYIIFTSGSTGEPKGVPISRGNLNAFYAAYQQIGWKLDASDRMLQMFELTFDVSVVSTLYPLAIGACIYTVGYNDVKYLKIFELLEQYELTFAAVAPSVIQLISPYLDEIHLPSLKYLVVTAEASQTELLDRFRKSIPNAEIYNLYGPTEATIYCTYYPIPLTGKAKQHNGMVAIGKPFDGIDVLIVDENGNKLPNGTAGEMWVAGPQVMKGYYNDSEKTGQAFAATVDGTLYYKTGDLCIMDDDNDIIYCGRKDYQVKIQGFRIELSEIEYTAKQFFDAAPNIVVIPVFSAGICSELHMAVEVPSCDKDALYQNLSQKLPYYMLPKRIHLIEQFPTTASNKIDRKQISQLINPQS